MGMDRRAAREARQAAAGRGRIGAHMGEATDMRGRPEGMPYQPLAVTHLGADDGATFGMVKTCML